MRDCCVWRHQKYRQTQQSRTHFKVPALKGEDLGVGDSHFHRKSVLMRLPYKPGVQARQLFALVV
jgi:hypothetical protein